MKEKVFEDLICVVCGSNISIESVNRETVTCLTCKQVFPIVNDVPIVIDEAESIFAFSDFVDKRNLFFDISQKGTLISRISDWLPSMGGNNLGKRNFKNLESLLTGSSALRPRVLVVGGSIVGEGMSEFVNSERMEIVEGDVSFGPRTKVVFDAHSIPYAAESFDCVVVQAVLEHVINPKRCVEEISRVLKPGGIVYAETPFMQQVHGGPYDFTRYSHSGHRKLFDQFEEIESGSTAGSGTALAWSYQYFLLALFGHTKTLRLVIKSFARLTGFWLKYFDYVTRYNKYDFDGASGFYFLGKKSGISISDKDLIGYYTRR